MRNEFRVSCPWVSEPGPVRLGDRLATVASARGARALAGYVRRT
jgi:hypothetical protein